MKFYLKAILAYPLSLLFITGSWFLTESCREGVKEEGFWNMVKDLHSYLNH